LSKRIVCVACPIGCEIDVQVAENGELKISGNRCKRGYEYAKDEVTDPKRVLTMSVKVEDGEIELVSVKTDGVIPKKLIPQAIEFLKTLKISAPVNAGDVLVEDLLGTGVKVVATRTVPKRYHSKLEIQA